MKAKRWIAVVLSAMLMLAGCGGSPAKDPTYIVSVMFYGSSVDTAGVDNLITQLNTQFPDLASKVDGIGAIIYSGSSAEGAVATMGQISLDMNDRKIGIVVSDNAGMGRFNATESLLAVSEIFSEEELAAISYPTLTYQPKDVKGNPAGDPIVYGWDISSSATLSALLGGETDEIGLIKSYPQKINAKKVLYYLLTELEAS